MENFGELLKKCVEKTVVNVSEFSREIGINRGWLYYVFDGTRKLPEEKFRLVLEKLKLPAPLETRLRTAYYVNIYGEKSIEKISYIYHTLKNLAKNEDETVSTEPYEPSDNTANIAGIERIAGTVQYIMENALAQSSSPKIYTNYPYSCSDVDNTVYSMMREYAERIDMHHFIEFDIKGEGKVNLQNLLYSLRFVKLRCTPLYCYADIALDEQKSRIYPYFFASESCLLLFNPDSCLGIFICEPSVVNSVVLYANRILPMYRSLAVYPKNEMDLKQVILSDNNQEVDFTVSSTAGMGEVFDREVLEQAMRQDLPARDTLIQIASEHWGQYSMRNVMRIETLEAVERFAKTGKLFEVSCNFAMPLPVPVRKQIFEKKRNIVEDENWYIIDKNYLTLPKDISIEVGKQVVMVSGIISQDEKAYLGEYAICLTDRTIIADLFNFREYILRNGFVVSENFKRHLLDDLILGFEKEMRDGE